MQENSGFHYECGVNKFILGLIGVWPESNQKFIKKHRTLVDAIVLFITLWVPRAAAFILLWGEIDALAQAGATNVPIALSVVKLLILYRRKNDFAKILDGMKEDWRKPMTKEEYEVVMKMARLGRRISILSTFLTINAIWLGAVVQIFYNIETTIVENPDPRLTLNLFWVVYLPYDTSKTSNFVLTWVIHFYTSIMSAVVYGSFDGFIVVLVFHLCGQLDLLKIWARKIADKTDLKSFKRKLRFLVKRHEQLNEVADILEDSCNFVFLPQLMSCILTFCFQGFSIATKMFTRQFNPLQIAFTLFYTTVMVLHLFFCCWAGELLSSKSQNLGYGVYQSKWYNLPSIPARSLIMIIQKSSKPFVLTAGKYMPLTYNLFLAVVKTSMSYLSVMFAMSTD
ncbi:odorant receptor 4-like isoform X4 [Cotesia typhae]|uniref:odorant receptor 4-like isoform X4 n=1 Tax=Cotesia typhae TaxID=2053667 RepID=UPI003D6935BF